MDGKKFFKARKKSKNRILSQENRYFDLFYQRIKNFGALHLSNGFLLNEEPWELPVSLIKQV